MAEKKPRIYKSSSNPPVFDSIKGIIFFHGQTLNDSEKLRLKGEALTFKSSFLYQLLANRMADEMQREIVENHTEATPNGKDDKTLDYYRAILADRRILIQEIDNWSEYKPPSAIIDTTKSGNIHSNI